MNTLDKLEAGEVLTDTEVRSLLKTRDLAREIKNYQRSDYIRDKLLAHYVEKIKDDEHGRSTFTSRKWNYHNPEWLDTLRYMVPYFKEQIKEGRHVEHNEEAIKRIEGYNKEAI